MPKDANMYLAEFLKTATLKITPHLIAVLTTTPWLLKATVQPLFQSQFPFRPLHVHPEPRI